MDDQDALSLSESDDRRGEGSDVASAAAAHTGASGAALDQRGRTGGGEGWRSVPAQQCPCSSPSRVVFRVRTPRPREVVLALAGVVSTMQLLRCVPQPAPVKLLSLLIAGLSTLVFWRLLRARDDEPDERCISLIWFRVDAQGLQASEAGDRLRRPAQPLVELPPLLQSRVDQLSQRTRICSRQEWEDNYLPKLLGRDGAEKLRSATCSCCICLADIEADAQVRGLACGHIFHLHCLAQWFMRDQTYELCCPLCRLPLSKQGTISVDDSDGASGAAFPSSQTADRGNRTLSAGCGGAAARRSAERQAVGFQGAVSNLVGASEGAQPSSLANGQGAADLWHCTRRSRAHAAPE